MYKTLNTLHMKFFNGWPITLFASETIKGVAEAATDQIQSEIYFLDIIDYGAKKIYFVKFLEMGESFKEGFFTIEEIQAYLKKGYTVEFLDEEQEPTKVWLGTIKCLIK